MKTRTPLSTFIHKNMHTTPQTHSWIYAHHSIQSFMKIHTQLDKLIHENTQKTWYTHSWKYLHHLAHLFIKICTRTPHTYSWKMRKPFRTFRHKNTHHSKHVFLKIRPLLHTPSFMKTHSWKLSSGGNVHCTVQYCICARVSFNQSPPPPRKWNTTSRVRLSDYHCLIGIVLLLLADFCSFSQCGTD